MFQGRSVLFELRGLPFKEKRKIKSAVTDNGGSVSYLANKECSLIVTTDVSSLSPNRLRNSVTHQIPVVGLDYVSRCLEAGIRLSTDEFRLDTSALASSLAYSLPAFPKGKKPQSPVKPSKVQIKLESAREESVKIETDVTEKNRIYHGSDHDLPKFPENFQVAKYTVFEKTNSRSWAVLELQSAKSGTSRQYSVVRYWKEDIQSKKAAVRDRLVFVSTSEEALKVYQAQINSMTEDGLKQRSQVPAHVNEMGSAPLQQLLLEEKLHTGRLSEDVCGFVELLWQEALGCLENVLKTPVHKISLNDVTRAEGLLLQVHKKCSESQFEEMASLWSEYLTLLPRRVIPPSPNIGTTSRELDLCQLIRDILNMSEMTLGSTAPSSVGKYRALRCSIEEVPKGSSEFEDVTSLIQHSKMQVHQILRVNRAVELQTFQRELGNIRPLLHSSSPRNFVGILSRGLLPPHVVVEQHGIERTDAGNLGSGIYFSDAMSTTLKYSQCCSKDGSRMLLVCDVALGQCKDLHKKDLTLTQPPVGHDSVHGVRNTSNNQSEFMDDEYVVYSPDQVRLKYVVQFNMEGEQLRNFTPEINMSEEPSLTCADQEMAEVEDDIENIKNPLEDVTAGLLNSSGQQIPLQAVHVKCKLIDLLSQVIIFQKYTNDSSGPIEAKYVFPLDDSAAVSGFEAFINGKHVVGQVKEKETARKEYKQAIEKGHGAYLMDQDAPDVFTISVGNLPPGATVLIKITFVSELIVKNGSIVFALPSSVAPWQESAALNQTTQITVEKVCVTDERANAREFSLDMSIEMPYEITEVKCITHKVKMKRTDCKAVVSVLPEEVMGPEGFQLSISLSEVHMPRMWVEKHPDKDSQACMLVFYPNFKNTKNYSLDEVVILVDASQSMKGEPLKTAQKLALQFFLMLDFELKVNVIFFGTDYNEAFPSSQEKSKVLKEAKNFVKNFSSTGGSTELWRPLRALSLLPPSRGVRNLVLFSDGHIQNAALTLQLLRENVPHTRLFTCGLSPTANRHMLRALAQAGGGAYEFFDTKTKHTWIEKVKQQCQRMDAPCARSVSVKWQQFNPTAPPPVQAPKQLHALFNDFHTLVYGFVPHCTQATLMGNLSGEELKTMVSTSELQKTKGTFLHKLTARALIRDFEDGNLDSNEAQHEGKKAELKSFIIELSKEYSILSQFTSFVAIEERDSEEEKGFTDIPKLIADEDVDFLPYIGWDSTQDQKDQEDQEADIFMAMSDFTVEKEAIFDLGPEECEDKSSPSVESLCGMGFGDSIFESEGLTPYTSVSLRLPPPDTFGSPVMSSQPQIFPQRFSANGEPSHHYAPMGFGATGTALFGAHSMPVSQMLLRNQGVITRFAAPPPPPPPPSFAPFSRPLNVSLPAPPPASLLIQSSRNFSCQRRVQPIGLCNQILAPAPTRIMAKASTPPSLSAVHFDALPTPTLAISQLPASIPDPVASSQEQVKIMSHLPLQQNQSLPIFTSVGAFSPEIIDSYDLSAPRPVSPAMASQLASRTYAAKKRKNPVLKASFDDTYGKPTPSYASMDDEIHPLGGYERTADGMLMGMSTSSISSLDQPLKADMGKLKGLRRAGHRRLCIRTKSEDECFKRHDTVPTPIWTQIFELQHSEGYWELTAELGSFLNLDVSRFADNLRNKGIKSLGVTAHADILKLLATLLVLQLMRIKETEEGLLLRTLFCLEDSDIRPDHWEAVERAVKWVRWADSQYPCVYSRLELGLSWDSATKQLLGFELIHHWSPLTGLNLNPVPVTVRCLS